MPPAQRLPPWPDLAPLQPAFEAAEIVGLFEWDVAAGTVYPCLGMVGIFGLDTAAIRAGVPPAAFLPALHPDDRAVFADRAELAGRELERTTIYRVVDASGSTRTILECARFSIGPDGEPDWACGALFDYPGRSLPAVHRRALTFLDALDRAATLAIELRRIVEDVGNPTLKSLVDLLLIEIASTLARQEDHPDVRLLN